VKKVRASQVEPEFTRQDDPEWKRFVDAVSKVGMVRISKLYGLWWMSPTFRARWSHEPDGETDGHLMFSLAVNGMRPDEMENIIMAWMGTHGRANFRGLKQKLAEA